MSGRAGNRLLLAITAVLFSTGGAVIKATTLDNWQVAGFRSGIAAAVLFAAIPSSRRIRDWRIALVGLAYAAMLVLFVQSTKLTTAANAIFLQSTAPLYLLLIGPVLLREPVRRAELLVIAAVAAGMVCVFAGPETRSATALDPALGNRYGALSGLAWALSVAGLRWLGRRPGAGNAATATVAAGNTIAFLICLPMALPVARIGVRDAAALVYLGVVQIGLAYVLLTRAIRHVPALEAATLLLLEPALSPVWAWMAHGERPGPLAIAGGIIIVAATLLNAWRQSRPSAS